MRVGSEYQATIPEYDPGKVLSTISTILLAVQYLTLASGSLDLRV